MQNSIIVNEWIILNDMVDITSNQQNGLQFILIIKIMVGIPLVKFLANTSLKTLKSS